MGCCPRDPLSHEVVIDVDSGGLTWIGLFGVAPCGPSLRSGFRRHHHRPEADDGAPKRNRTSI